MVHITIVQSITATCCGGGRNDIKLGFAYDVHKHPPEQGIHRRHRHYALYYTYHLADVKPEPGTLGPGFLTSVHDTQSNTLLIVLEYDPVERVD